MLRSPRWCESCCASSPLAKYSCSCQESCQSAPLWTELDAIIVQTSSKKFRWFATWKNKAVCQYPCSQLGNRCHFYLLDLYTAKLPVEAKKKDMFYLSPLQKFTKESKPWFSLVPLDRNTLDQFVNDLCHEAGIDGKTNHSLWATGTTQMYRKGIPGKAIQSQTGHKNIEALRMTLYERVSNWRLFRCTFQSHHCVASTLLLNFR